jgi:putative membrane protein
MPPVKGFVLKVGINAVAIWVASYVVSGVHVGGKGSTNTILTLLVVGALFGFVNALIKPIVVILTLPINIVTLGLFTFVINAMMLEIVAWLSDKLGIAFAIDRFFWNAIGAAVVVSLVSLVLSMVLKDRT